jgi:hypothetical protein
MFTEDEIARLLRGLPIEDDLPFDAASDLTIRAYYEPLVRTAEQASGSLARVEWDHYGSGYASFVDAWFYPMDGAARVEGRGEHHAGVWVLLSRTSRYFVLGQGEKAWNAKGSSSYMPRFADVDAITHPALIRLAPMLTDHFTAAGLKRLRSVDLAAPLAEHHAVPGNLGDPPFHEFDALFHWED